MARNVGVHEISFEYWLTIGETEVEAATKRGNFPSELMAIVNLFQKVFGCTLMDAQGVLGDKFINDPTYRFFNRMSHS
ncbi:hypothetical protein EXIGLDRAFT_722007 [Exidia glandulosa HHB12029]|uniref:Uncharacterized protein n=1 Tax=Exidia glandulosa HHB12029 TaxID=1314781 RepID=A0A166A6Z6_EXIGL|nr:hypothetical protein EXIGLDRAFT_722007 [Exidia glandulosa HHB12029]